MMPKNVPAFPCPAKTDSIDQQLAADVFAAQQIAAQRIEREWLALDARRQALASDLRTVETAMTRIKCEVLDVLKMRGLSNEAVTEAVKRRAAA